MEVTPNENYTKVRAIKPLQYSKLGGKVVPQGYASGFTEDKRVAVFYQSSGPRVTVSPGESYYIIDKDEILCYVDVEEAPELD